MESMVLEFDKVFALANLLSAEKYPQKRKRKRLKDS